MSSQLKFFITGATGYIGGSVLARLLKHKEAASFSITTLVQSAENGDKLKTLGVNVVVGSYSDADLSFLTDGAAQSDFVFAIADSDQFLPTQAILKGLKIKYEKQGKASILIHTSGTGLIADDAQGLTSEHMTYSDLDIEKFNAFPESVKHRNVDIPIIEADKAGYVKSYIIAPAVVFGHPPASPLVDLEIQKTTPPLSSHCIKPSVSRKQGGYFGKGLNGWSAVSVDDNADLYLILFDAICNTPEIPGHGVEGYSFTESFVNSYLEMARVISEAIVDNGVRSSKEPSAFTKEIDVTYGIKVFNCVPLWTVLAANSYAKAERSRALGWNPKSTKADFLDHVREEVKGFLAELR